YKMEIISDYSLKDHNTFGINANAKEYVQVTSTEELAEVLRENKHKELFILGGGSNMLLTQDINALVIHIGLKGREVVKTEDGYAHIKAMAGDSWNEFVLYCIDKPLGGLENLSL